MRKKSLLLGTCLCLALSLAACKQSKSGEETTPGVTEEATPGVTGEATNSNVTVTLGEYKGIEVTMLSTEVTDEDIQSRLDSFNEAYGTPIPVADKTVVEHGDIVNIDYVGKIDGEAFQGGTDNGSTLVVGSGQFIDGFEDGVLGKNVGDIVDITCTFPEDYHNSDVAGKEAVFTVTINFIDSGEREPITDAVIEANDPNGNKTVEEYKEFIRTNLETSREQTATTQKNIDVITKAIENATFTGVEQSEYDEYEEYMLTSYQQAATQAGMDLETYVYYYFGGMQLEDFNAEIKKAAQFNVNQKYLLHEVAKAENMILSDEEFEEKVAEYMAEFQYEDEAQFLTDMGGKTAVTDSILLDQAMNLILDSAVVVTE